MERYSHRVMLTRFDAGVNSSGLYHSVQPERHDGIAARFLIGKVSRTGYLVDSSNVPVFGQVFAKTMVDMRNCLPLFRASLQRERHRILDGGLPP